MIAAFPVFTGENKNVPMFCIRHIRTIRQNFKLKCSVAIN